MTDSPDLERGYRRLLACYPRAFRREHAEEVLAVLMASAPDGQKRPRLAESADVFWSALKMRLRGPGPASENRPWADALALFSLVAPLFLLLVDILNVALPYRLRLDAQNRFFARAFGSHPEIGALPLLNVHIFTITVGAGVVLAVLVLLGLRWAALAALVGTAVYWAAAGQSIPWIPYPLQLLTTGVFIVEAAALVASPGPRRGRQLMNWRGGGRPGRGARPPPRTSAHELAGRGHAGRGRGRGLRVDVPLRHEHLPRALGGLAAVGGHVLPGRQRCAGGGCGDPGGGLETYRR